MTPAGAHGYHQRLRKGGTDMNRHLIRALSYYGRLQRLALTLRGRTPESHSHERLLAGRTWDEFCDTLKLAGHNIMGPGVPHDALTQAEGFRYLSRVLRAGLEAFVEYADPQVPALRRMVHETVKIGADNPDNHYLNATISGTCDYRLSGTRGSVHFLGLSTQKGGYGESGGLPPTGFLDSSQLQVEDDGTFEVILSSRPHGGNWLPMEPDTGLLIVRQTFLDSKNEVPARLEIERLGDGGRPGPLTAEQVDRGLTRAANLVAGVSFFFARWANSFQEHTNELPLFDPEKSTAAGGDPDIAYYHSYWRVEPHEALVIDLRPPRCSYWNFQLNNHWMESLDYRYYRIHVNKHTATCGDDGSVRIVVAHRDPGLPNWLDTCGHSFGTMCLRWVHAEHHPTPNTRLVTFDELPLTDPKYRPGKG